MVVFNFSEFCSKEGNVLFNNILNTFYLQLYGVGSVANAVCKIFVTDCDMTLNKMLCAYLWFWSVEY